ncbi:putative dynein axonemal heavy chain-like protein [Operophtera brumata]|uniref:Putative dynein axonemal heavy chain-like protein n=1 Tax=Operophtera brumata TaxID=104452 RepID=A0A0L7LJ33_OPEBR|nr:putative dynein axonemal heavy chain-like protein [Operophtera brumata]
MDSYSGLWRIVKPKKERLEEALESLRMKQQILAEARAKLRELSEMIARLQKEYEEKEFDNLPGDCLIATGFVAYLGPFMSDYRDNLMDDWFREGQALIWIAKLEEPNDIQVVDTGQPGFLKVMENSLTKGTPILVHNVGEVLDPSIAPILDKAIVKIGNALVIKFNEKMVSYDPKFRMYLTTKLG